MSLLQFQYFSPFQGNGCLYDVITTEFEVYTLFHTPEKLKQPLSQFLSITLTNVFVRFHRETDKLVERT